VFTGKLLVIQKLCSLLLDKEQQNNILGNLLQDMGDADRATAGDAPPEYRVRARRGQSTNPRSLAERVRKCSHLKYCYRILSICLFTWFLLQWFS